VETTLRGEAAEANALAEQLRSLSDALLCALGDALLLVRVVYEVAAGAVGAEADGVEGATRLRLVLGMPVEASQLVHAVRELAFGAVLAGAALLVRPAQLRLVASGHGRGLGRGQRAVADAQAGRWRKGASRRALASAHVTLDHAHGPVHPEGDLAQRGARQLGLLLADPGLVDGRQRPRGALVAVEFGVGESHRAQGVSALESHHTPFLCGICKVNTSETLGTHRERERVQCTCCAQVSEVNA